VSVFFTAAHFNNTPTHTHTLTYTQVVCCMNLKSGNVKGVESNGRLLVATSKEVRVCVCVCMYVCMCECPYLYCSTPSLL
jgi:hypothetical protein